MLFHLEAEFHETLNIIIIIKILTTHKFVETGQRNQKILGRRHTKEGTERPLDRQHSQILIALGNQAKK